MPGVSGANRRPGGLGANPTCALVPWLCLTPISTNGGGRSIRKRYYCSQCKAGPSRQFGIRIASPEKAGAGVHSSQSPDLIAGLGSNQEAEISRSTTATWGPGRVNLAPAPVPAAAVLDHTMESPLRLSLLYVALASLLSPGRSGKCSSPSHCRVAQEESMRVGSGKGGVVGALTQPQAGFCWYS